MKVAVVANIMKDGVKLLVPPFINELKKENIDAQVQDTLYPILGEGYIYCPLKTLFNDADMIISFGGDGTILRTARDSVGTGIPILGVNLGKVGFLAEISPAELLDVPARLKNCDFEIMNRMAFIAETNSGEEYFALNDIAMDRNTDTRILEFSVSIDDIHAGDFAADGLIISTPTGSTAHSVSAGGPLVMPECNVIILTPICPHSLTLRPLIIDGSKKVCVEVLKGLARMAADGQSFIDIPAGCKVYIKRHENPIKIARFKNKTYFDILHTRLNWGVSLKLKNA
jgi:NAD+ kinase